MAVQLVLYFIACFVLVVQTDEKCGIANVQVENEDGTTQVFEVKKLEPVKEESCVLCDLKPVNSVPGLTVLRSNVFVAIGEASLECGIVFMNYCDIDRERFSMNCSFVKHLFASIPAVVFNHCEQSSLYGTPPCFTIVNMTLGCIYFPKFNTM